MEARHEGYLTKKGDRRRNWKRRWFTLENGVMTYYKPKEKTNGTPKGLFSVAGCRCGPASYVGRKYANSFQILARGRTYYLRADDAEEAAIWKKKLQLNSAIWDENLARTSFIHDDGTVEQTTTPYSVATENEPEEIPVVFSRELYSAFKEFRRLGQREDLEGIMKWLPQQHQEELEKLRRSSQRSLQIFWRFFQYPPIDESNCKVISETITTDKGQGVLDLESTKNNKLGRVIFQREGNQWKILSEMWRDL